MSEGEFLRVVENARARTTTVVHRGRDWHVTPFHCVVGPIGPAHFGEVALYWSSLYGDSSAPTRGVGSVTVVHRGVYDYVSDWARDEVGRLREQYAGSRLLFYAQDPLVVNEMLPGEVSLAVVEDGEVVLTNFVDLFDPAGRLEAHALGEWWLSYAVGGVEPLSAVSVLVQVAPPWCDQSVSTWARACTTHVGTSCDGSSSDECRATWRRTRVPAWSAYGKFRDPRTFEVVTCRTSPSKIRSVWRAPKPTPGAGFCVLLVSREAKAERRHPGEARGGEP